jgi:acetamidase/formamidase
MNTTIVVDVIKGAGLHWPRLQDDTHIMSTGSVKPLEDAFRISQHDLIGWTRELTGLDDLDALQLVSQAGLAPVGNVVDTNYTMVAKLPVSVLNGASVYDGIHEHLAGIGREHVG